MLNQPVRFDEGDRGSKRFAAPRQAQKSLTMIGPSWHMGTSTSAVSTRGISDWTSV